MKRFLRILVTAGMLMALLLSFGMAAGEAKNPDTALPEIPVSISTRGTYPAVPEEYTVRLTADGDFPMPEGSTGSSFDLKVTGPGPAAFPAISYSRVGIYTYTMRMVPGTYAGAEYDDTVYTVKITVSNLTDGGFGYTTAIRIQGEEDKKNAAAFTVIYPAAKTQRTVVKVWDDKDQWGNENGDGIRPTALAVSLMRGTEQVGSVTLSAANGWTGTVSGLDRFETDTRTEITYTWVEGDVTGAYSQTAMVTEDPTSVNGGATADDTAVVTTITNSHIPETTSVKVIKQWDDDNDRDGRRPKQSTTVRVYLTREGENGLEPVLDGTGNQIFADLSAAGGWEATVSGLPKYRAGAEITYRWVERVEDYPDGYRLNGQTTVKTNGIWTTLLVNRYETESLSLTVQKVWDDTGIHGENQDGIRPATLDVRLLADGAPAKNRDGNVIGNRGVLTLRADSETPWALTVENLPVYRDQGQRITYTWEEVERGLPRGYTLVGQTTSGNITTFTNRHVPEETEITVRKFWDDQDNQDGLRTAVILRVIGQVNGRIISREPSSVIDPQGETSAVFSVPVYYQGERITYTVDEDLVPAEYTKTVDNSTLTVTNRHTPWTIDIPVRKVWDDNQNQDGFRAATSIVLTGTVEEEIVVTRTLDIAADAEGDALGTTFEDLPVRYQGKDIVYSVSEAQVARYEAPMYDGSAQDGFTVTNRHAPEKIDISGTKIWNDDNNRDGKRPESINVFLMADGQVHESVTVTAEDGWTYRFTNLDKYQNGRIIVYTLAEEPVDAYDEPVTQGTAESGTINIINTHTPETVNVTASKIWDDAANQDGLRPAELTVTLLADNTPVTDANGETVTRTLSEGNGWSASVEGLPKYQPGEEGHELVYSWAEPAVTGYTAGSAMAANGNVRSIVLTNRHETLQTVATVQKAWDDADNQDGIRPEELRVTLLADGEPALDAGGNVITRTLSAQDNWTATVEGLDLNAGGRRIVYSWREDETAGYTLTSSAVHGTTVTLTNTHIPEVRDIAGMKVWDDADNQDGYRPEIITVTLLADNTPVDTVYVSKETGWAFRFEGKPKYRDQGTEIEYTVAEGAVQEYEGIVSGSAADGFTVTNTHIPEETEISVEKIWDDAGNQDGLRPASVTVVLRADGAAATDAEGAALTAELNEGNGWTYIFRNLPRKKAGKDIVYTVTEERTAGYEVPVIDGTAAEGYTVTNTRVPSVMDLDVNKVWDDDDNRDGLRPAEIIMTLLRNGTAYRTVTLQAPTAPGANPNIWTYHFTNLPVNEAGMPNVYTVQEAPVEGYAGTIAGYTLTNTHTPATTARTVRKVWAGDENMTATRPESVVMTLMADGTPARNAAGGIIRVTLSADNGWDATVTDLPVYENGREITYRWQEEEVPRYRLTSAIRVPTAAGETTTITNTRNPAYTLTVYYLYLDTGETAAPTVEEIHDEGDVYDVDSPTLDNGYVTVRLRVTGVMPDRDVVEYVYYYRPDVIITDFETPLGLGQVFINIGDCIE